MSDAGAIVAEALIVTALGVALGYGANAVHPDGLHPTRDHFPRVAPAADHGGRDAAAPGGTADPASPPGVPTPGPPSDGSGATDDAPGPAGAVRAAAPDEAAPSEGDPPEPSAEPAPAADDVVARLEAKGLQAIRHEDVVALYEDEMYSYGLYAFVDARRSDAYRSGHIPDAWHFDPFYPNRIDPQLTAFLPTFETIVVYCSGGDCEDSESAALLLQGLGAEPVRLFVYPGGISRWKEEGGDLEAGERGSGRRVEGR